MVDAGLGLLLVKCVWQHPAVRYTFVWHQTEDEYKDHFCHVYCEAPIFTFDSIGVQFYPNQFFHAFYGGPLKDYFDRDRAQRMNWIGAALGDDSAELYVGWNTNPDRSKKKYERTRRVAVVRGDYAVIIGLRDERHAVFITAFGADPYTLYKIRGSPPWPRK